MKSSGLLVFFAFLCQFSPAVDDGLPPVGSARMTPTVRAVHTALPSVVNIATEQVVRVSDPYEAFFNDFFRGPVRYFKRSIPLGSGVIIDPRGLVITNHHVVRRASNIDVRLLDGKDFKGRLIAHDRDNDLALLQLQRTGDTDELRAIPMARPHDLLLGETVVAVGNPFGLGHSVTTGILSAIDRHIEEGEAVFDDILQTDAAINPGNSGGPLINLDGELIGLNLAIRRDAEGIGFAVPAARIESVASKWMVPCRFSDGILGLFTRTRREADGTIVEVEEVQPDTPADKAGLGPGDVIAAVDGVPVSTAFEVGRALWVLKPGSTVDLEVDGRGRVSVEVAEMTEEQRTQGEKIEMYHIGG
jgi:S1-C subfamily serine protease